MYNSKTLLNAAIAELLKPINMGGEPYFANMIYRMNIEFTNKIPTMGVTVKNSKVVLYINEEFLNKLTTKQAADVLKHECMHILNSHLTRGKVYGKQNQKAYNVAADLAINHLIPETAKLYGATVEKLNKELKVKAKPEQLAEYYMEFIPKNNAPNLDCLDDHSGWDEIESDELAQEVVKKLVKDAHSAGVGQTSSEVNKLITEMLTSKVNWKNQLRMFVTNTVTFSKETTRKKRNRRYGIMFAGKRKEKKSKLAICVDASGSISDESFTQFFAEIDSISKVNDDIIVIEADTEVHSVYNYRPGMKIERNCAGGTAYNPSLQKAKELKADGIIFMGDFDCFDEPIDPKIPVLWVGVGSQECPANFGKTIYIKD